MYKISFTLKQHTPLIHFQHDQEGATLRASEVKPKLDRYLINSLGGIDQILRQNPEWLQGKDNESLLYSLNFRTRNIFSHPIKVPKIGKNGHVERDKKYNLRYEGFPCYFGNMGEEDNSPKSFIYTNSPVEVSIDSNSKSLIGFMSSDKGHTLISRFFNTRNFSTRQSKGFGSFTMMYEDGEMDWEDSKYCFDVNLAPSDLTLLRRDHNLRFPNSKVTDEQMILFDDWKKLFHKINLFHKVLKSGYNQQNGYVKSALFKYFKEIHKIQWDKKTIKEKYFIDQLKNQQLDHLDIDVLEFDSRDDNLRGKSDNNNLFLVRDLLGLTSEANWRSYTDSVVSKENPDIDRFMSPLTYKPVLFTDEQGKFFKVFLFFNKIPDEMLNQSFSIKVNGAGNLVLDTPRKGVFSLSKFFEYLVSEDFHIEDLINSENRDTAMIQNMFNSLKSIEDE